MKQDDDTQKRIFELISLYGAASQNDQDRRWCEFLDFIRGLADQGWSRGEIYDAALFCLRSRELELSPTANDALSDFLAALAGHCDPKFAIRLPNDPCTEEEFVEYVRSLRWMSSSSGIRAKE